MGGRGRRPGWTLGKTKPHKGEDDETHLVTAQQLRQRAIEFDEVEIVAGARSQ